MSRQVVRGSAWDGYFFSMRTSNRYGDDPIDAENVIGFRCVNARLPRGGSSRGGSWLLNSGNLRVATRFEIGPTVTYSDVGFRMVAEDIKPSRRVLRGSAWYSYESSLCVADRGRNDDSLTYDDVGFRRVKERNTMEKIQKLREKIEELEAEIKSLSEEVEVEFVAIPSGEFQMGSNDGYNDERPVHIVKVASFQMSKHLITNAQYRKFVEATGHRAPKYWNDDRFNQPNQPVVGVSWHDAQAFCEWAGGKLPTEEEWEYAARGGLVGKKYPWGDEPPDETRANYGMNVGNSSPVGSYPPNGYGLYDMAGNVWEWCQDEYDPDAYKKKAR